METFSAHTLRNRLYPVFTLLFAAIGWFASWELATEYVKKLKNPEYVTNCEFSLIVTCSPNMESWQGSVFGFSNTFLGLTMFVAPIALAVALFAGARFRPWFWWLYLAGLTFGFGFIFWLSWQSVFVIGTLCPWCMVVWAVMILLFWTGIAYTTKNQLLGVNTKKIGQFFSNWSWVLIILSYALIATYAQIALDWIGHVF